MDRDVRFDNPFLEFIKPSNKQAPVVQFARLC